MTLYISGPMSGYPEWNFPAFFAAEEALEKRGMTCINPARQGAPEGIDPLRATLEDAEFLARWKQYLADDLKDLLQNAEGVVLLPGWRKSNGAILEAIVGAFAGLQIFEWIGGEHLVPWNIDKECRSLTVLAMCTLVDIIGANSRRHGGHVEWQAHTPQYHLQKVGRHALTAMSNLDMHEPPQNGEGAQAHMERVLVRGCMALSTFERNT
jgi:hypothetical protein